MPPARLHMDILRILLLGITCMVCLSCSEPPPQPFRIGTNLWPGYEPLYLARHNGHLDDHIRLIEYPSATDVLRAFRNNSLEAACLTLDEVLLLRQHSMPVTVILVTDISHGSDAIVAQPDIQSIKDLPGKKIAVESGALGAYVITRALELNGISIDQVHIRHLGNDSQKDAFENDSVDAVVSFDPLRTQLLEAGGREIFTSQEIPGEIVDVLVIRKDVMEKYRQDINTVIQGWFKSLRELREAPEESAAYISRRLKISHQQVLDSFEGMIFADRTENIKLLGGEKPRLLTTIQRLQSIMIREQLLEPDVDVSNLLSDQFIRRQP